MICAKCDTVAQQLADLREMQRFHSECLVRIASQINAYGLGDDLRKKTGASIHGETHARPDRPSDDT